MIFLIVYDRRQGTLKSIKPFGDSERLAAEDEKLEIELDYLQRRIDREVVLIEAEDEQALRRTHRRYFESAMEIGTPSIKTGTGS